MWITHIYCTVTYCAGQILLALPIFKNQQKMRKLKHTMFAVLLILVWRYLNSLLYQQNTLPRSQQYSIVDQYLIRPNNTQLDLSQSTVQRINNSWIWTNSQQSQALIKLFYIYIYISIEQNACQLPQKNYI